MTKHFLPRRTRERRPEPLVKVRIDPPKLPKIRLLPRRAPRPRRPEPLVKVRIDPPRIRLPRDPPSAPHPVP